MQQSRITKIARALATTAFLTLLFAVPATFAQETYTPSLSVNIPTVTFSQIKVQPSNPDTGTPGYIDVPWLAEYILGVYRYGIALSGVVASVIIVIGGFQYMTGNAAEGKEKIRRTLVGIVLVLGSYVILRTISPNLTNFNALRLISVDRVVFEVPEEQMVQITGKSTPSSSDMINKAMAMADAKNLPGLACFVKGSMEHESKGKQNAIGHDENVRRTFFPVSSRQRFLQSGRTYLGKTFAPIDCHDRDCQKLGGVNDDSVVDPSKPDLGLDQRFSHGIGAGQSTIMPTERGGSPCPGREAEGNGFRKGGKCYTARDLLDPDKSLEAMMTHYEMCWRKANGDPARGYVCYGGNIALDSPVIIKRVKVYDECMQGK